MSRAQSSLYVFPCDFARLRYRKKAKNSDFFTIMRFPQCGSAHPFALDEHFPASPRASHSRIIANRTKNRVVKPEHNSESGGISDPAEDMAAPPVILQHGRDGFRV